MCLLAVVCHKKTSAYPDTCEVRAGEESAEVVEEEAAPGIAGGEAEDTRAEGGHQSLLAITKATRKIKKKAKKKVTRIKVMT